MFYSNKDWSQIFHITFNLIIKIFDLLFIFYYNKRKRKINIVNKSHKKILFSNIHKLAINNNNDKTITKQMKKEIHYKKMT